MQFLKKYIILFLRLLKQKIKYKLIIPVRIQNITSSIHVIKSDVLNDFLNILNISNKIPIKIPFIIKIINEYAWLFILSHPTLYLNILPNNPPFFLSISFSLYPILYISPSTTTSDVSMLNLFIRKSSPFTVNNPQFCFYNNNLIIKT